MQHVLLPVISSFLILLPSTSLAQEVFGGLYAHAVETPFSMATDEGGVDLQLGYRFETASSLELIGEPAPYAMMSLNSAKGTSFAGGGLSWKLALGPVYARPEIGLVVHNRPSREAVENGKRVDLGSRVLVQPGISLGMRLSTQIEVEASWIHISHGQIFNSRQNPGLDMWGVRLNWKR
jgi:lipid A 3-O-deacylase